MGGMPYTHRYRTMEQCAAEFELEKSTKNTHRYSEIGEIPKIGTLYIQKSALGAEPPAELKVTVEVR